MRLGAATGKPLCRSPKRESPSRLSARVSLADIIGLMSPRTLCLTHEQMFVGGGCHGKLAGESLEKILACASGSELRPEDSALIEAPGQALLFSNDLIYLPGLNLYDAGRIAALHALSDIYASGGRPRWALVTLLVDRNRPLEHGEAVMAGITDACAQEGVAILGGHTATGNEAMAGLSVIGVTNGRPLRKTGALPGDKLFLSKPIGTGLCLAGFKHGLCGEDALAEAIAIMLTSGKDAATAASRGNASACTDVTGFGLLGHLSEMLSSTLGAELTKRAIPVLAFAGAPPRVSAESSWMKNNYEYAGSRIEVRFSGAVYELAALLDPQTNGPLLVAAPAASAGLMLSAGFAEIGVFTDRPVISIRQGQAG
jgi:selenide,water dikinase